MSRVHIVLHGFNTQVNGLVHHGSVFMKKMSPLLISRRDRLIQQHLQGMNGEFNSLEDQHSQSSHMKGRRL